MTKEQYERLGFYSDYSKQAEVKGMVYASSLEVYGSNHTDEWISEDFQGYVSPTEVRSSYNMGKRASECMCHSYAKEYNVYILWDFSSFVLYNYFFLFLLIYPLIFDAF